MKIKLYILLFLISTSLFAQKVTTSIDTTRNKIGAEFKITLKTSVSLKDKVVFPNAKNFGALEVINSYKVDTVKTNERWELIKKYGVTQFDSGKYTIPRIQVLINGKPNFSDSLNVEVFNVKVDTLKQKMYDIKDVAKAETPSNWWKYLIAFLLLIGIAALTYWVIKKQQNRKQPEELIYTTPIEKATSLLQQLETKELWQKGEVKNYYTELTNIARIYIEEEIEIPAMESTTSELIEGLRRVANQKNLKLSKETLENLEKVLMQADLVKFAKEKPLDFEIEEDKKRISNSIVTIHKAIPIVDKKNDELEAWNEKQRELARIQKLKKQKQVRIYTTIAILVSILLISFLTLIYIKGWDYVKDNLFGNPTKELAEGEWVYSEYGIPGVKIETPRVLKRMDGSKILPKDAYAVIKEMQMFGFGTMMDSFSIMVSTSKFKNDTNSNEHTQQPEINFDTILEGNTKIWESLGGQNIIFKQEDFKTVKGITGVKAYGTMTMLDKSQNKSQKLYYEVLLFKQEGGLQQIVVSYKEDDNYGKKVMERIINSVELKNDNE